MTTNTLPKPPAQLGRAGRKFWTDCMRAVTGWTVDDLAMLTQCCALLDTIGTLPDALKDAPLLVPATHGGQRENPILSELRQTRASLVRSIKMLGLPDDAIVAEIKAKQRSESARHLALRSRQSTYDPTRWIEAVEIVENIASGMPAFDVELVRLRNGQAAVLR